MYRAPNDFTNSRRSLSAAAAPSRWVLSDSRSHLPQLYFPDVLVTAMHEVAAIRIFDDLTTFKLSPVIINLQLRK